MKNLKNGIIFLILAFFLETPNILLRLFGVITVIMDRDWLSNAVAVVSIIGVLFYIIGLISIVRYFTTQRNMS